MKLEKVLTKRRKVRNALIGVGLSGALMVSGCETFLYGLIEEAGRQTGREFIEDTFAKQEEQVSPQPRTYFFTCNYFKDFNNDGVGDYPNEFVGIKNRFRDDEKIVLVSYDEKSKKGQLVKWEIYNPSGKLIGTDQTIYQYNGNTWRVGENFDTTGWLIQNGGYGNFKAVWYLDGKYTGSTEFEIVKE